MRKSITAILLLIAVAAISQNEVQIGNQVWMRYNLITDQGVWYNNDQANAQYGKLYTWAEAMQACPDGWHLPTKAEWRTLDSVAGGSLLPDGRTALAGTSARNLRETGWAHWYNPFAGSTMSVLQKARAEYQFTGWDDYGFTALPGGYGYGNAFYNIRKNAYFWTATDESNAAWYRGIGYAVPWLTEVMAYKEGVNKARFSVRCVKD